jgi:o-succinylbenzoate synthase
MEARLFKLRLPLKSPFRIAHGTSAYRDSLFVHLSEGGAYGMGEAPIVPYYGLSAEEIEADLSRGLLAADLGALGRGVSAPMDGFAHPVSRSALRAALLSLRAAREGRRAGDLLGLPAPTGPAAYPQTSYTVVFDEDPAAMAEAAAACGFRRLKIKAGLAGDIEGIRAVRERLPEAIIRVDANQGWSPAEAGARLAALEGLGVELVEEPIAGSPRELEALARATSIPILLDESARDLAAVRRYAKEAPSVAGIVVKTAKNGGPEASLALARAALEAGMRVMLSSMVETSLGVGAALPLAPLCSWLDLDAPLLLVEDPFIGLSYVDERPLLAAREVGPGAALAEMIAGLRPLRAGASS